MQLTAEQHECFAGTCERNETFVLTTHMNPDGDALGSQIAVARYLESLGKTVRLINGDPTPEILAFVTEDSPPIEVYDPGQHDNAIRGVDCVVLLDNSAPDRLGRMESIMLSVAANVLCIDHHPTRGAPWAENILQVGASSTAVLVWDLVRHRGWEPDAPACNAIFVGLATDTGFFRFNSASPHTQSRRSRIPLSMARSRPRASMRGLESQTLTRPRSPMAVRTRKATSPVPPATSRWRQPGRGRSQSTSAAFHSRRRPPAMRSFIRS